MKYLFLLGCFVSLTLADKLNNVYLPPSSARTAGGSGSFLSTPHRTSTFGSQNIHRTGTTFSSGSSFVGSSYVPPASGPAISQYGGGNAGSYQRFGGSSQPNIGILKFNNDNSGDGSYRFEYETENRISQNEQGSLKSFGAGEEAVVVHGSYSYTSPEGQVITVNYVADENGFRAEGDHLPTSPPIPAAIQKSLAISAADSSQQGYYTSEGGQNQLSRQYLAPKSTGGYQY